MKFSEKDAIVAEVIQESINSSPKTKVGFESLDGQHPSASSAQKSKGSKKLVIKSIDASKSFDHPIALAVGSQKNSCESPVFHASSSQQDSSELLIKNTASNYSNA